MKMLFVWHISDSNVILGASLMSLKTKSYWININMKRKKKKCKTFPACLVFCLRLSSRQIPAHLLHSSDEVMLIKRGDDVYWSLRGKLGHCSRTEQEIKIKKYSSRDGECPEHSDRGQHDLWNVLSTGTCLLKQLDSFIM